jgi:serine/threonine-protein kinase RsbT
MGPGDKPGDKAPSSSAAPSLRPSYPRLTPLAADPEGPSSLTGFALVVHRELSLHLSQPNCRALLAACASACGVAESGLTPDHLPTIASQIDRTFAVFGVRPDARARCIATLRTAAGRPEHHSEILIPILQEGDVVTARNAGKDICHALNFTEVAYVKVTTAISELARNILKYAGKGQISVRRLSGAREGIEVIATDQGPGIADIDLVLSPKYRSRTGMGVGLRGSRRLMDHFEIKTKVGSGSGTTVLLRKYKD